MLTQIFIRVFVPVLFICIASNAFAVEPTSKPADPRTAKIRICLAGDSTVTNDAGWGAAFARLMNNDVEVVNISKGGRSSLSFITEGRWKQCIDAKPDYIFIQFGHNDEKVQDPTRYTDPNTSYQENYHRFIKDAREVGAKPVIVTSVSRRTFDKNGKIQSKLIPYVEAAKKVAGEENVPVIDLHARSIELYEKLGKEGCEQQLSPRKVIKPKEDATTQKAADKDRPINDEKPVEGWDGTHFTTAGAKQIAPLVVEEMRKVVPELTPYLIESTEKK